jgi:hypothetical protein
MKQRYLVFIAVSCVFFLLTGCQQQAKVAEKPAAAEAVAKKGEPKIEFESMVYDFGQVRCKKAKGLQADAHSPRYFTRLYIRETYSQL